MKPHLLTIGRAFLRAGFGLAAPLAALLLHAPQAPGQAAWESLERPDGRKVEGRLEGAARPGFSEPWVITRTFSLRPDLKRIDEFICENNRDYRPFFGNK